MVDVLGPGHDGSIVDLTLTGDVQAMGSDEEEYGMGDGGSSSPMNLSVSYAILPVGDHTFISRGLAGLHTWTQS